MLLTALRSVSICKVYMDRYTACLMSPILSIILLLSLQQGTGEQSLTPRLA